jgi:peptidyl-prolyl cis-trans isomerase C
MKAFQFSVLVASTISVFALSACDPAVNSPSAAQGKESPAAATVNGKAISQRTVDMLVEQSAASGRPDSPETRKGIIDQLALQMLLAEEAVKKGLDKTPDVMEEIEVMKQAALASAFVQDYIENNPVSDEALKAEYDRIKASITGDEYKASHILVEKEAEAKEIIAKLDKDPAAFAQLAKDRSQDTGSKGNGGDLGWFDLNRMVPEFSAAVSKLEKGKFTEAPVQSQFGYHIILLEDVRPIEAPPLAEVTPQLTQQIQQQDLEKLLKDLQAGATIEVVGAPAAAAEPAEAEESATE